jgi:hypothetical protein
MNIQEAPPLLSCLNKNHCISTKWIADEVGKDIKKVHDDVRRILGMVHVVDHEKDHRGYSVNMWLELPDALYMMAQYSSHRAEKAKQLVRDAIRFYIYTRPRMEAENRALREQLSHKDRFAALLEEDNTRLRNENQAAAAKLPTPRAAASRRKGKRMLVPVLHGDLFHGVKVLFEYRHEEECTPWQWALGMIPWLMHVKDGLDERVTENKELAFHQFLEKFNAQEITREQVEDAWRRVIDEIQAVPVAATYREMN